MQTDPDRLGAAREVIDDPEVRLLLSAASAWEMSVKFGLGRLPLPSPPATYVPRRMRESGVGGLPVTHQHALAVAELPDHHRDPFDRMLVAQAAVEQLTIITADSAFERYEVPMLRAGR